MTSPTKVYEGSIRILSILFLVLGIGILATTLAAGGGPLSIGTIMGVAFLAVGVGRLWVASRMSR